MEVCYWLLPERNKWEMRRGWLRWASRAAAGKLLKLISPWFYLNMLVAETATLVLIIRQEFILCLHSKFQWRKWGQHLVKRKPFLVLRFLEADYILERVQEFPYPSLCTELQYQNGVIFALMRKCCTCWCLGSDQVWSQVLYPHEIFLEADYILGRVQECFPSPCSPCTEPQDQFGVIYW